jgi:hypothetical protein
MDRYEYIFAAISMYIDGYTKMMMSTTDGCSGIVDWNPIGSIGNLRGLIDTLT